MARHSPDSPAKWEHPLWFLLLGPVLFVVGVLFLQLGGSRTPKSEAFVQSPGFAVWAATVGVQVAFWVVVAFPLWADLVAVWNRARQGRSTTVVLAAALLLILVVFPTVISRLLVAPIQWPLWGHWWKTLALTSLGGLLVGVPALSGITLVHQRVRRRETEEIEKADVRGAVEARTEILRFLSLAGAVIGLAVLTTGALRKATVPVFVREGGFPQEWVLLYGAFFTGLLLLVYVPAHLALKRLALRIRDHYFRLSEMPDPDADSFKGWLDKRTTLETLLQLNVTPSQQLQASLFILAPLLSAILTSLVPKPG